MDKEQRKFIINKIEKHNEEIDSVRKKTTLNVLFVALGCAYIFICMDKIHFQNMYSGLNDMDKFALNLGLGLNTLSAVTNSVSLISNFSKKVGAQQFVKDLEKILEINEYNNEKGIVR